jgi:mono/diheme cytochrome c family protein
VHHAIAQRFLLPALLAVAAACGASEGRTTATEPPPTTTARLMHGNVTAIRDIFRALLFDDLASAKSRARDLAGMAIGSGSPEWDDAARLLRAQAARLADARDANQARSLATATATYCADCHMFRAEPDQFRPASPPAADGSLRGAMARHAWAADTMWLGVIAPSTDLWRQGLAELAAAPQLSARGERAREVAILRARLRALASRSGDLRGQGDRAARLAEVMDVCAACHAITRRDGGR